MPEENAFLFVCYYRHCFHSQKHLSACGYLSLAGYVEALASRMGLSIPDLTPKQADMWQTRLSAHLVSVFHL